MEKKYPYQHNELNDLPFEIWKDIPGFEGHYRISNLGRIKSLSRFIIRSNQSVGFYTKERILSPHLVKTTNKYLQESFYRLSIKLYQDNKPYSITLARYVYHLFVAPFDLSDLSVEITYADQDRLNVSAANLGITSDRVERNKQLFASGRRLSPMLGKGYAVCQYDVTGQRLATFPTVQLASLETGCSEKGIREAIRLREKSGGFYWAKAEAAFSIPYTCRQVAQYSLSGECIKIWPSVRKAAQAYGKHNKSIRACAIGNQKTAGNYVWKYVGKQALQRITPAGQAHLDTPAVEQTSLSNAARSI